jgi:FeS assembly SUF system regulator
MIKLSKLSDYAIVILGALAALQGKKASASALSQKTGLPEPTVAKVLKLLNKEGIVSSVRGANGGYTLQRGTDAINVYEVLKAIEGPMALAACVEGSHDNCAIAGTCPINGQWDMVNKAMRTALQSISLANMIAPRSCSKHMFGTINNDEMRV